MGWSLRCEGLQRGAAVLGVVAVLSGCGDEAAPSDAVDTVEPQPLGASCREDGECISRLCMTSQYGTPFCTRPCSNAWEPCPAGDDVAAGQSLCVSYEDPPNPQAPAFEGELLRFCVPRCQDVRECAGLDPVWEACDVPRWLGDPLFPALGSQKVCQSPSFHGKVPVDPAQCDWERTVKPAYNNEANLCRAYCEYLDRCKELEPLADTRCCEWGCFNRIVVEDTVQTAWRETIRCYIDNHAAFPETGPKNACTEPPVNCGGSPLDPTPAAARP